MAIYTDTVAIYTDSLYLYWHCLYLYWHCLYLYWHCGYLYWHCLYLYWHCLSMPTLYLCRPCVYMPTLYLRWHYVGVCHTWHFHRPVSWVDVAVWTGRKALTVCSPWSGITTGNTRGGRYTEVKESDRPSNSYCYHTVLTVSISTFTYNVQLHDRKLMIEYFLTQTVHTIHTSQRRPWYSNLLTRSLSVCNPVGCKATNPGQ